VTVFPWRNSCSGGNEAPASLTLRERSSSVTLCSAVERNYHHCVERNRELIPPDTDMFRVMDGAGDGIPGVFVDQMADRLLVSTRGCSIPADLESELRDTGMPVFHKKLEQNQKETF
jgi:23S rRNA G2069 N7-methylase RlmK/C1962 C5-methylase RlmI